MIFSYDNLIAITGYFFVALSQFLVVYAISHRYTKENRIKILAGATSPALFILIGFPFYLLGILKVYAYIQMFVFIIIYIRLLRNLKPFCIKINFKRRDLFLYTIFFVGLGYFLSFESFNNVTYAFEDTLSTHEWNESFFNGLSSSYYPGFAIYLSPIYLWINPIGSLDFLGFATGFILLLYTSVALEILKKYLGLIFLSLLSLTAFDQTQLMIIAFSPNKFFVLYLGLLVVLLHEILISLENLKISIFLLCSVLFSLSIASPPLVPYFFVILTMSLIWGWSTIKQILSNLKVRILFAFIIVINIAILYAFVSKVSPRSWLKFNNLFLTTPESDSASKAWLVLLRHALDVKFIIDPFNSTYSFFGGLSIIFAMIVTLYSIRKRHVMYGIMSSSATLLGLSTFTGILQITMIEGRVGWYFSVLIITLVSLLLLEIGTTVKSTSFILFLSTIIFIGNLRTPPEFFRSYSEEIHRRIFSLGKNLKSDFYLYSQIKESDIHRVLNPKVVTIHKTIDLLKKVNRDPSIISIVVLDFRQENQIQSPTLIKKIPVSKNYIQKESTQRSDPVLASALKNTLLQKGFTTYFADNNYVILIRLVT